MEQSLQGERRNKEDEHELQRIGVVGVDKERQDRDVERHRDQGKRRERPQMRDRVDAAHKAGGGSEESICGEKDKRTDQAGQQILAKVVGVRNKRRYYQPSNGGLQRADRRVDAPLER